MPVNSIPANQAAQTIKQSDITSARKQTEIRDADKVKDRKDAAGQNAQIQQEQAQKAQPAKASINTNGQKVGTLINTAA